jgi:hypothetical protein
MNALFRRFIMKKFKFMTSLVLTFAILIASTNHAYAYATYSGEYKINGGVGNYGSNNRYYYITSSISTYAGLIDNAVSSWVYTTSRLGITTPISIVKTTTQSASVFDFYLTTMLADYGTIGQTNWFTYSGSVTRADGTPTSNWDWTKITFNTNTFSEINLLNNTQRQGVAAHELGHAMGLAHIWDKNSIMYPYGNTVQVYQPQGDDCDGINHLY